MQALASIHLSAGPGELKGWDFGFIQVVQANTMSVFYAGRTRKEGSIAIQAHLAPALKTRVLLAISAADSPWIGRSGFPQSPPVAKELMKDHPSACASKTIQNANTKRPNFLFHILTELESGARSAQRIRLGSFSTLRISIGCCGTISSLRGGKCDCDCDVEVVCAAEPGGEGCAFSVGGASDSCQPGRAVCDR